MRRLTVLLTVLLIAVSLPLAEASAKMGKSSMGSRGTRTYDRPVERSLTPPPAPVQPQIAPAPVYPTPQPLWFAQRNPMLSGFMGRLLGVGIGSMLFGHPAYASYDAAPGAGVFGLLLQLAIIGGLGWLAYRLFRGAVPQAGYGGATRARGPVDVPYQVVTPTALPKGRIDKEFEPSDQDKNEFGRILVQAQQAWTNGDLAAMSRLATPEMVSWLSQDLTDYASRGQRNVIEDVHLARGEITESWREGDREFATAVMTYTARDLTVDARSGQVIDGDPSRPVESTEAWTFVRVPGGAWLLSAIER
jgi:predicted lipid-binding transport protein (Tim44 family)